MDAEFAYNRHIFYLILLIIILEQVVSTEMILYAPDSEEIFIYPYVIMEYLSYNAIKDVSAFFNEESNYFVILVSLGFYIYLLYQLLFVDLKDCGSFYSAGLGLALGGLFSDALLLLFDGGKVAVYLTISYLDISSYAVFNLSTLCMIIGTAMCALGVWFTDEGESGGGEAEAPEEPNAELLGVSEMK